MKIVTDSLLLFLIVGFRYFFFSGLFYLYFYRWRWERWKEKQLAPLLPSTEQIRYEIFWSLGTTAIFALTGGLFYWAYEQGYTRIYLDLGERGWGYYFLSLALLLFLHDAYFYWVHRGMHHRIFFRLLHKIHHDSRHPTPFTSFSFHPLESLVEAVIVPLLAFLIPVHWSAYLLFLMIMTVSGVVNHLGIEIFPASFSTHWFGKWFITPSNHELHHVKITGNYGLYFTWWDKLFDTERSA